MKKFIFLCALSFIWFTPLASAITPTFPSKPIRIIVPFGPGGVADLSARIVAQQMTQILGQNVIIDNKPGAGGIVAAEIVAKSEPDGHTLLLMSNGTAVSASLFKNLSFDPIKDFVSISTLGYFDMAIITENQSPIKNLNELLNYSQKNPGKLNLATINIGSSQHLAAELFKQQTQLNIQIIPFNGTPAVITALRGQQVQAGIEILSPLVPQIESNAIRLLAVTGAKRSSFFPNIPTVKELGVKNFEVSSWNGLAAPAKTSPEIISLLNTAVSKALETGEVKSRLKEIYVDGQASKPQDMHQLLERDIKKWARIIKIANIPKQ